MVAVRASLLGGLVGLSLVLSTGCATSRLERRADEAQFRATMHQQRAAQLEAENAQLRGANAVQQVLLVQSMVAQLRAQPRVAEAAPACVESAPANPLIDLEGTPVNVLADEPAMRDIAVRIEAMLGRPMRPHERLTVLQLLRRPRTIDATDPWILQ